VALRPHDQAWEQIAGREIPAIRDALRGFALVAQHVGCTAVPDLPSKPIIDIAVAGRTTCDFATRFAGMQGYARRTSG
jgi:GrpB-like predicted nucleotidyltransferase (UPF0157 family)